MTATQLGMDIILPPLAEQRVFFDIETIRAPDLDNAVFNYFHGRAKPSGNLKDPVKIAEWYGSEKHTQAAANELTRTSFDGLFGESITIGYGYFTIAKDENLAPVGAIWHEDVLQRQGPNDPEERILEAYFKFLNDHGVEEVDVVEDRYATRYDEKSPIVLVGHNIIEFDIKFLNKRALVKGIKLPQKPKWPRNLRPWSSEVEDTMLVVDSDKQNRVSADKLAFALGQKGKGDIDGSDVGDLWNLEAYDMIGDYCLDDVRNCRDAWLRLAQCGLVCF